MVVGFVARVFRTELLHCENGVSGRDWGVRRVGESIDY